MKRSKICLGAHQVQDTSEIYETDMTYRQLEIPYRSSNHSWGIYMGDNMRNPGSENTKKKYIKKTKNRAQNTNILRENKSVANKLQPGNQLGVQQSSDLHFYVAASFLCHPGFPPHPHCHLSHARLLLFLLRCSETYLIVFVNVDSE